MKKVLKDLAFATFFLLLCSISCLTLGYVGGPTRDLFHGGSSLAWLLLPFSFMITVIMGCSCVITFFTAFFLLFDAAKEAIGTLIDHKDPAA